MSVHRRFRFSSTAGRVEEERRIVRRSGCRCEALARRASPYAPLRASHAACFDLFVTNQDDRHLGPLARGRQEFLQRLGVDDCRSRLAVFKVVVIVRRMREWIYGHRDGADFCGAKECRDEFRRIRKQDQNAVASRYSLREQRIAHAVRKRRELCVRDCARFARDRQSFRVPPGRLIQKMPCHIQSRGNYFTSVTELFAEPARGNIQLKRRWVGQYSKATAPMKIKARCTGAGPHARWKSGSRYA